MGAPHSSMGFIMVIPHFQCSIVYTKYIVIKIFIPVLVMYFQLLRVFVQFYVVYSIFRFVFHLVMCLTTFVDFHELTRAAMDEVRAARAARAAPVVAVVPAPGIAPVVLSAARIAEMRAGGHRSSAESAALDALDDVAAVHVDKDKSDAAVEARRLAWNRGRDDSRHNDEEKKRRALHDSMYGPPG